MTHGCQPQDCCGDPEAHLKANGFDLEAEAEAAAERARCTICDVRIMGEKSRDGVLFGRIVGPFLEQPLTFQVCGLCGLKLREFIVPDVLDDPVYVESKATLLREFWT